MTTRLFMFQVKICGVTSVEDAVMIASSGADAIGLNFIPGSPRCLDLKRATEIAQKLPSDIVRIGVFVGRPSSEMLMVAEQIGLDAIQLHGLFDGPPEKSDPPWRCDELKPLPVIRAVRLDKPSVDPDRLATARQWIDAAAACGCLPAMALLDASVSSGVGTGAFGGTGNIIDWKSVAEVPMLSIPTTLAGGLTPDNVAAAIQTTRASAVDTASGVESSPGQKNSILVRRFVAAAKQGFSEQADI